ncbi:MAG: riboflavin synthase [Bdellovibrionota bacterium]
MFTGLITDIGKIAKLDPSGTGSKLWIETRLATEGLSDGESIAVNGVCLTVTSFDKKGFGCEASKETLDRSTLGNLKVGSPVNLERALCLGDRLGGHLVQGHVDGTAALVEVRTDGTSKRLTFELPDELLRYVIEKGSIALNGISLTVNAVQGPRIEVNIIPATWEKTSLSALSIGGRVNVEVDLLGKYVERLLTGRIPAASSKEGRLTVEFLAEHGFLEK